MAYIAVDLRNERGKRSEKNSALNKWFVAMRIQRAENEGLDPSWLDFPFLGRPGFLDERQITHLICARLKYDLYDFWGAVLGLFPFFFLYKMPKNIPRKII